MKDIVEKNKNKNSNESKYLDEIEKIHDDKKKSKMDFEELKTKYEDRERILRLDMETSLKELSRELESEKDNTKQKISILKTLVESNDGISENDLNAIKIK